MVLTCIFWALFFLPGYAFLRWLSLAPRRAGLLYTIALGYAASLLLLSPLSLLCYLISAPLIVFSAGVVLAVVLALIWLARARADRELLALLRDESLLFLGLLAGLLWLQARLGGWLDGDATFHLGRMRVLLEHGFTNRDIYLAKDYFQRVYHTNLVFPVYASVAQLTHQSYLETWFYSEAFAKLLVAAGHYALGYLLTRQRFAGQLLALLAITANAGETYALYPNTLAVGYLLPLILGCGLRFAAAAFVPALAGPELLLERGTDASTAGAVAARRALRARFGESRWLPVLELAALDLVLAQVHALYAVYAALLLGPVLLLALLIARGRRWVVLGALASLAAAAPFVIVSTYSGTPGPPLEVAPDDNSAEQNIPSAPMPGIAEAPNPRRAERVALTAGGGHLEKVLESPSPWVFVFDPGRMGGRPFVVLGYLALGLALLLRRSQLRELALTLLVADALGLILFLPAGATLAVSILKTPFVVARLSTALSSLLLFGICAGLAALLEDVGPLARRVGRALMTLSVVLLGTQLLGHAPYTFLEHVTSALAPRAERFIRLETLLMRKSMLDRTLPSGATVLTTARFARQVVMLRDCYVLAADRGHTAVAGIDKRRRDIVILNAADTPWETRARLIQHYDLRYVTFENRWRRRYSWAYSHGKLIGSRAGQDVIELDPR